MQRVSGMPDTAISATYTVRWQGRDLAADGREQFAGNGKDRGPESRETSRTPEVQPLRLQNADCS